MLNFCFHKEKGHRGIGAWLQAAIKGVIVALKPKCARYVFAFFRFGVLLMKLAKKCLELIFSL